MRKKILRSILTPFSHLPQVHNTTEMSLVNYLAKVSWQKTLAFLTLCNFRHILNYVFPPCCFLHSSYLLG